LSLIPLSKAAAPFARSERQRGTSLVKYTDAEPGTSRRTRRDVPSPAGITGRGTSAAPARTKTEAPPDLSVRRRFD